MFEDDSDDDVDRKNDEFGAGGKEDNDASVIQEDNRSTLVKRMFYKEGSQSNLR